MTMTAKFIHHPVEYRAEYIARAQAEAVSIIDRIEFEIAVTRLAHIMAHEGGDPMGYYRQRLGLAGKLGPWLDKRIDLASWGLGPIDLVIADLHRVRKVGPSWTEKVTP